MSILDRIRLISESNMCASCTLLRAEDSWKNMTQASKIDTKHVCIEKGEDLNQRTRNCEELTWFGDEMACDSSEVAKFVALDFEALDVNEALNFRGFDLSFCTLYIIKKNEALIWSPHFISRIPLLKPPSTVIEYTDVEFSSGNVIFFQQPEIPPVRTSDPTVQ